VAAFECEAEDGKQKSNSKPADVRAALKQEKRGR